MFERTLLPRRRGFVRDRPGNPKAHGHAEDSEGSAVEQEARTVSRGRAARTPFVALGGVATVVWLAVGLIALAAILVWWLV